MRSKLYPVERNLGCQGCGNFMCLVCKSINITDKFSSFTTKKRIKWTIVLIATINVWFICWDVSHAVNNMQVTQTVLELDGITIRVMRVVTRKMSNKSLCKVIFYSVITKVRLIDKTQSSDPTKREFYWMITLRNLYPDSLNIESDY